MPADEHLSGMQFEYLDPESQGSRHTHRINAFQEVPWEGVDKTTRVSLGHMSWDRKRIVNIDVRPEVQRRGVATALWEEGHRLAGEVQRIPRPKHSADRTTKGDAWARSVGGSLPRRTL